MSHRAAFEAGGAAGGRHRQPRTDAAGGERILAQRPLFMPVPSASARGRRLRIARRGPAPGKREDRNPHLIFALGVPARPPADRHLAARVQRETSGRAAPRRRRGSRRSGRSQQPASAGRAPCREAARTRPRRPYRPGRRSDRTAARGSAAMAATASGPVASVGVATTSSLPTRNSRPRGIGPTDTVRGRNDAARARHERPSGRMGDTARCAGQDDGHHWSSDMLALRRDVLREASRSGFASCARPLRHRRLPGWGATARSCRREEA